MIVHALIYTSGSWLCAVGLILLIYLAISLAEFREIFFEALWLSAQAAWLIPAILLVSRGILLTEIAGLLLIANSVRLLLTGHIPETPSRPSARLPHVRPNTARGFILGAMALQFGLCAAWVRQPLAAIAAIPIAVAIWTFSSLTGGWFLRRGKSKPVPAALTMILATLLLAWQLKTGAAAQGSKTETTLADTTNNLVKQLAQASAPKVSSRQFTMTPVQVVPEGVTGVILQPKTKKQPQIRMSEPAVVNRRAISAPMAFPFTGEYHLYPTSTGSAPADSMVRAGSPLEDVYRTFSGGPVETEAYQPINPPFDFRVCGQLEITVSSEEEAPGILSASLLIGGEWLAVGADIFGFAQAPAQRSVVQTFRFDLPVRKSQNYYVKAIRVLFYRDPSKKSQSARVAVVGFGLIPKVEQPLH